MNKHRFLWITVLLVALTASACATTATTSKTPLPTAHTTKIQPIAKARLPLALTTGPITYVALGASDAVGVGSNQPGSQGYVPLLATHFTKRSHLVNLGISGIRVHEAPT